MHTLYILNWENQGEPRVEREQLKAITSKKFNNQEGKSLQQQVKIQVWFMRMSFLASILLFFEFSFVAMN